MDIIIITANNGFNITSGIKDKIAVATKLI